MRPTWVVWFDIVLVYQLLFSPLLFIFPCFFLIASEAASCSCFFLFPLLFPTARPAQLRCFPCALRGHLAYILLSLENSALWAFPEAIVDIEVTPVFYFFPLLLFLLFRVDQDAPRNAVKRLLKTVNRGTLVLASALRRCPLCCIMSHLLRERCISNLKRINEH